MGSRIQGRVRARAIKGIPISTGLANWSKRLRIMVRFKRLFLIFLYFGERGRWERHELGLLVGLQ